MEQEYKKGIEEWVKWYNWNRSIAHGQPIEARLKFVEKAIHGLMILTTGLADQVELVDTGKKAAERGLWIPGAKW